MKNIIIVFVFLALMSALANSTYACFCNVTTASQRLKEEDAVFVGRITSVIKAKRKWRVAVINTLSGDVPKTIILYAAAVGTDCETSDFKLNTTYVFFANKIDKSEIGMYSMGRVSKSEYKKIGNYEPSVCSWTDTLASWKSPSRFMDKSFAEYLEKAITAQSYHK